MNKRNSLTPEQAAISDTTNALLQLMDEIPERSDMPGPHYRRAYRLKLIRIYNELARQDPEMNLDEIPEPT